MSRLLAGGLFLACLLVEPCLPARGEPAAAANKKPAAPRTDRYGDPLPKGAIARLGTLRFRVGSPVFYVAYSPDGRLLATSGVDGTVCMWQATTGKEIFRLPPPQTGEHEIPRIQFSPDGKLLAVCRADDDAVRLCDANTGKERLKLNIPIGQKASSIAFSPDGTILAGICWEQLKSGDVYHCIRFWWLKTGKETVRVESPEENISSFAFAPDGKSLVVGQEYEIYICDAATGRKLRTLQRCQYYNGIFPNVTFSSNGIIASTTTEEQNVVRLWDAATGREKGALRGHKEKIYSFFFSRDGKRLISSTLLEGVFFWDVASGKRVRGPHRASGHSLALSPDGKTLVSKSECTLRRWDMATGEEIIERAGHRDSVGLIAFTADGRVVTSGPGNGDIRTWEAATGKQLACMQVERTGNTWIHRAAFSPDARIMAASCGDGAIRLWDLKTGKETAKLAKEGASASYVAFSPDGKTLAGAYCGGTSRNRDGTMIVVWDLASGKPNRQIRLDRKIVEVGPISFSPDGKRLASLDGLWDAVSGEELGRLRREGSPYEMIRFSPDGSLLAAPCHPSGFAVWDVASRGLIGHFNGPASCSVAFSPDGRLLACGKDDGIIELWEVLTWTLAGKRQGRRGGVYALSFSADGRLLASGHEDTTALIWDVPSLWAPAEQTTGLTKERLDALWAQLGSGQAAEAYRVIAALSQTPDKTLPLLRKHVRPARAEGAPAVSRLIADLDADTFAVREKASRQLQSRGPAVIPTLREALAANPSPEARRRMERILETVSSKKPHERTTDDERWALRAVAVLERIGTPEARQLLGELAKGAAESPLTRDARAAQARLSQGDRQDAKTTPR